MDGAGGNHGTPRVGQWELCFGMTAVLLHFFIYSAGPHAGVCPQTGRRRRGRWRGGGRMALFSKHGGDFFFFNLPLSSPPSRGDEDAPR